MIVLVRKFNNLTKKINADNLKDRVEAFNAMARKVVDLYASLRTKKLKVVLEAPWFDLEYLELRKNRRKAEK